MHRRQTQDLTPLHLLQLRTNNPVQSGTNRVSRLAYQHTSIIVKLDNASIWALKLLLRANNDGVADVTATYFIGCGCGDRTGAWTGFWAEVALLLDDYDDAFA